MSAHPRLISAGKILLVVALFVGTVSYFAIPSVKSIINNSVHGIVINIRPLIIGVTSTPVWQTWIAPYRFYIGLALGMFMMFLLTRFWVRMRRVAIGSAYKEIGFQRGPSTTPPQVIPSQTLEVAPPQQVKKEGE